MTILWNILYLIEQVQLTVNVFTLHHHRKLQTGHNECCVTATARAPPPPDIRRALYQLINGNGTVARNEAINIQ